MIETIAIVVGGSLTVITSVSLWFVSVIDKRERARIEKEEEDAEQSADDGHFDEPWTMQAFVRVTIETTCPHCCEGGSQKRGPKMPKACRWGMKCAAHPKPHLHMECVSCFARWPMSSAIEIPPADGDILPFVPTIMGTKCPKCGEPSKNNAENTTIARGPVLPQACDKPDKCRVDGPHMHMRCVTCRSSWFMATADTKKDEEAAA